MGLASLLVGFYRAREAAANGAQRKPSLSATKSRSPQANKPAINWLVQHHPTFTTIFALLHRRRKADVRHNSERHLEMTLSDYLRTRRPDFLADRPVAAATLSVGVLDGTVAAPEFGGVIAELKAVLPWTIPNLIHWATILGVLKDWGERSDTFEHEEDRNLWSFVIEVYANELQITMHLWLEKPDRFEGTSRTVAFEKSEAAQ